MDPAMQLRWLVHILLCLPLVVCNPRRPRWQAYSSSSYIYTDYNFAKPFNMKKPSKFVPEPQYCPNTGRTLCNDVKNYPDEHIFKIVQEAKTRNIPFPTRDEREGDAEPDKNLLPNGPPKKQHDGFVVYQTSVHYNYPPMASVPWGYAVPGPAQSIPMRRRPIMRRQISQEDKSACPVVTTYLPPQAGLNDNAEWKYVINVQERDPRLKQIIRVDVCQTPDAPCTNEISLPYGYSSRCKQKYMKKLLVALNANGTGTEMENFFIPSCCVCHVSRNR